MTACNVFTAINVLLTFAIWSYAHFCSLLPKKLELNLMPVFFGSSTTYIPSDVKTLDDPKKGKIRLKYDPYFIKKATKIRLQNFKRATPKKCSAHYKSIKSIYSLLIQSTLPPISDTKVSFYQEHQSLQSSTIDRGHK